MNKVFSKIFIGLFLLVFILTPFFVLAQDENVNEIDMQLQAVAGSQGADFGTPEDPRAIIGYMIQIALGTLGVIMVGFLVYAGFLITTSGGEEEKMNKGKRTLKYAIIGIIIVFSSYGLVLTVERFLRMANPSKGAKEAENWGGIEWSVDKNNNDYYPGSDPLGQSSKIDSDLIFSDED